ncbi:MAG: hypothetical protein ACODAJ_15785 [Planctomycetota bacterium]
MSDEALREELEAAYGAVVQAIRDEDPEAFLQAILPPQPGLEDAIRADFRARPAMFRQVFPDLTHTTFVAVRTEGADFAGYYHARADPLNLGKAQILLTLFCRVEGRWRLVMKGILQLFDYDFLENNLLARAREVVDSEPALRLERPPELP